MSSHQALTRMCLNNWHYINEKVLSFHKDINFFTGHSGSGKSTVLDALQIVLYADSNGRGFFNKAAKEDSDRSLIEYLRGMKAVGENDQAGYLRNKNFSTTIVLEFMDVESMNYQSIGVVFDVDVSVNDTNRMFFWHKGQLLNNHYKSDEKAFTVSELREYLKDNYGKEDYFISRTNEKFRGELYGSYFGGLHEKHFPALFKKAIPFKMDMKLEDFVKNYICVENDIHVEDMQDSVAQYTRLKRKLEDTKSEIKLLSGIKEKYDKYEELQEEVEQNLYNLSKLEITGLYDRLSQLKEYGKTYEEDVEQISKTILELEKELEHLQKKRDEILIFIENSGYEHLERELVSLNEVLEYQYGNKATYDKMANKLKVWLDSDLLSSDEKKRIHEFATYKASDQDMVRIKSCLTLVRENLYKDKEDISYKIQNINNELMEVQRQVTVLKSGQKAYPDYVIKAKHYLTRQLEDFFEIPIKVDILSDLLEIKDDIWRNAVEGYMGGNKLTLIVAPDYIKKAMEIYQSMDPKEFYGVSLIDTKALISKERAPLTNSLAEEVESSVDYAKNYVDYLLGGVIKCGSIDELREHKRSITSDCIIYQGFKLQHMDPKEYTQRAYIGGQAIRLRLEKLEEKEETLKQNKAPLDQIRKQVDTVLSYEAFGEETSSYVKYAKDIKNIETQERIKKELVEKINELKHKDLDKWKDKQKELDGTIRNKSNLKEANAIELNRKKAALYNATQETIKLNGELLDKERSLNKNEDREKRFVTFTRDKGTIKTDVLKKSFVDKNQKLEEETQVAYEKLVHVREVYLKSYAYRGFSLTRKDNDEYNQLFNNLSSERINEFTQRSEEQAKTAIYHFKTDFIYKIRDAIKEVMEQKEDLNKILSNLDFGKDKYRFVITKNKGEAGKFYDMFMDENLDINPYYLSKEMDNQMNLFALRHNESYAELMNELIELFMPPESSDPKVIEQARLNMEYYADYRTYLSFDMEQLVEGMPPMRLSRMLSKNSGGEGQNPLYVALLASFAQVYKISLKPNMRRRSTPRLVVLDEAFSKMDAEKVGSCIGLIRKLGFQAIISATNDKIQNYVDNVDKTFVYANPNKNRISIQEFEKRDFTELLTVNVEDEKQ